MKITKTSNRAKFLEDEKRTANIGCNVCPCCGERETTWEHFKRGSNGGISDGGVKHWSESGLFKKKRNLKVNTYVCYTCGAEWESETYEW